MQKSKKEVYKELLKNIIKTKSISKSTRNLLSEKGGRMLCKRLEKNGYLTYYYTSQRFVVVDVTQKGQELFNKLNDFNFKFNERELLK